MGLFNRLRKNKKEEVIHLNSNIDELLEESIVLFPEQKEKVDIDLVKQKYESFKEYNEKIEYEKNFAYIYSYAYFDDSDFENYMNELKIGLDIIQKNTSEINSQMRLLQDVGVDANQTNLIKTNDHLNMALALQRNVLDGFKETNNLYFNKLSYSAVSVSIKKNAKEMAALNEAIYNKVLENNASLNRAYEFVYYHSGDNIVRLVEKIVQAVKLVKNGSNLDIYRKSYFLTSDYVLTLDTKEWTNLYNKISFVYKMINDIDPAVYIDIKKRFEDFEASYMIILLFEEKNRVNKMAEQAKATSDAKETEENN